MKKAKEIDFEKAFSFLGPLNNSQTVYLANDKTNENPKIVVVKKIDLGKNFVQLKSIIEVSLRKTTTSVQSNILKPDNYSFQDGCFYFSQDFYGMSL